MYLKCKDCVVIFQRVVTIDTDKCKCIDEHQLITLLVNYSAPRILTMPPACADSQGKDQSLFPSWQYQSDREDRLASKIPFIQVKVFMGKAYQRHNTRN